MIGDHDAQYALDLVKAICVQVGPGLPGTPQERARAAMIHKEMESHLGAGNVHLEAFTLAPEAFLSLYPGVFMLFAILLNLATGRFPGVPPLLTATAALACSIVSPVLLIGEFFLGYELVDPLFRKKQSVNVIGTEPLLNVLKLTMEWICTGGECDQSLPAEIGAENG